MIDAIYYGVGATDFWTCKTSTRSGYTTLTNSVNNVSFEVSYYI